jgi:hypothetical protein
MLTTSCLAVVDLSLGTLGDQRVLQHQAHTRNLAPCAADSPSTPSPPRWPGSFRRSLPEHQAPYPGFENLDELQGLLGPAKKGTLDHDPFSKDVGKVTNDGEYLLELNSE